MKKKHILGAGLICFLLWAPVVHGIEAGLEMKLDQHSVILEQTINIEITARDIDGVAGGDILLYYNPAKLKLITKEFKLEPSDVVDIQGTISGIGDAPGEVRIFFGLKKDKPLLQGARKILAICTFKAIGIGETEIYFDPASQLVKEILHETKVGYSYVNPLLSLPRQIHITAPVIQGPEEPKTEPDDNPNENTDIPREPVDKNDSSPDIHGDSGDSLLFHELDIHSINQQGLKICSKIYWMDSLKPMDEMTLPYYGEDLETARLGIYYYHEGRKRWIYLGGEVHGDTLTVNMRNNNINFNKLVVLEDRTYPAFTDVTAEDMNLNLVKVLTLGIMKGYEDLTLRLDQTMSREEWVTTVVLALDVELKEIEEPVGHVDVSPWAQGYIQKAISFGLLGNNFVIGQEKLTVRDAVEVLEEVMKKTGQSEEKRGFILEREIQTEGLLTRRQAVALLGQLLRYLKV